MTTEPYVPDAARWDAFVEWARRFYEWEDFAEAERDYKLELGADLAEAREGFLSDSPDWRDQLRKVVGSPHVPIFRIMIFRFLSLLQSDPAMVAGAMRQVWATGDSVPDELRERVGGFVDSLSGAPQSIGTPESLAAFFLSALDPTSHPFYMWTPFNTAYQMTAYPRVSIRASSADKYGHAVEFLDELMRQAANRSLALRDRLDAQSLVWCVTQTTPEEWDPETLAELDTYRESGGDPEAKPDVAAEPEPSSDAADPPIGPDWPALAADLLWEHAQLEEIVADLEDKKQMIFYGPPGTGKTYVAKAIAAEYARSGGGFEIVQFHPSYSYEDFVEGYRPALSDSGQPGFTLTRGPLRRIAAEAAANPDGTYVLVIDELNRGNVAKVFGELYFLLEYRDEEIRLQYGGAPFRLPRNLLFICTMNTADRSIALMDAALRRRFYFAPFFPNEPPIEGLLRRWLDEHAAGMAEHVAGLVDRANELLDRDAAIGPSYFMRGDLDEDRVRRIWSRAVIPYVEEQCFGDEDKLKQLQYDSLMKEQATEAAPLPDGEEPDADADAP